MTLTRARIALLAALVALPLAATAALSGRQAQPGVWDGVYTEAQAVRGEQVYQDQCTFCHLDDLLGDAFATPLIGDAFTLRWDGEALADLMIIVQVTMPADQPNTLSDDAVADVTAFLLQMNEYPAGDEELPADRQALEGVVFTPAGGE